MKSMCGRNINSALWSVQKGTEWKLACSLGIRFSKHLMGSRTILHTFFDSFPLFCSGSGFSSSFWDMVNHFWPSLVIKSLCILFTESINLSYLDLEADDVHCFFVQPFLRSFAVYQISAFHFPPFPRPWRKNLIQIGSLFVFFFVRNLTGVATAIKYYITGGS